MIRKGMTVIHNRRGKCLVDVKTGDFIRLTDSTGRQFIGFTRDILAVISSKKVS